jgi:hypothetical protein
MMSDARRLVRPSAVAQWSAVKRPHVSIVKLSERSTMQYHDASISTEQREAPQGSIFCQARAV